MTTPRIEEIRKKVASEWKCTCEDCGHINEDYNMDDLLELVTEAHQAGIDEAVEKEWYLGKKIKAFGGEYIVVGISQMIYDKDCEGEPEWKMTKEVQEVAIAQEFDGGYSFQKPSWHTIKALQDNK